MSCKANSSGIAVELTLYGQCRAALSGQLLYEKGTRVVTGAFVGFAGVTESNNELDRQQRIDSLFRCGLLALSFSVVSVILILSFTTSRGNNRSDGKIVIIAQCQCGRFYARRQCDVGQVYNLTQLLQLTYRLRCSQVYHLANTELPCR